MACACATAIADPVCDELAKAVEFNAKQVAFFGLPPPAKSDPNGILRGLDMAAEASILQSNLVLMQANNFPLPRAPIDSRVYFQSVFACLHTPRTPADDPKAQAPARNRESCDKVKIKSPAPRHKPA